MSMECGYLCEYNFSTVPYNVMLLQKLSGVSGMLCTYSYKYIHKCVHTYIYIYMYHPVYVYMCVYIYIYIYIYIHTHTHTRTQDVLHRNCQTSRACSKGHLEQKTSNKLYFVVTLLSGYILQNLFNPMSSYLEILIMWNLRKVVPRLVVFLFTRKSFISDR
jgi:hypothetical protein